MLNALVIGTRKAGTTWLYSNLLQDERFCLSKKVKESGFFAGEFQRSWRHYLDLFENKGGKLLVEVDSSVCYSDEAPKVISDYSPNLKLILILRNPADYLASRYTHSLRKGEIAESDIQSAVENNVWLRNELDYQKIIFRFKEFYDSGNMLILPYELLQSDPQAFYKEVIEHITGEPYGNTVCTSLERVNVARNSKMPVLTSFLSNMAKTARKRGLHSIVNAAKQLNFHAFLERNVSDCVKAELMDSAQQVVQDRFEGSLRVWQRCYENRL